MDMEQPAFWLAGCILASLGIVVLVIAGVVVNNLLHTFWKPVKIFTPDSWKGFFPPNNHTPETTPSEPVLTNTTKTEVK